MTQVSEGGWSWSEKHAVGEKQIDRHAMHSGVGYLFSGLWRWKGEEEKSRGREKEREYVCTYFTGRELSLMR